MSAIIKACSVTNSVRNTGKECDTALAATFMLIAIQAGVKFTDTDLQDPTTWMQLLIQQRKAFPLFGTQAPIATVTNSAESDILVTLDSGLQVFLRYGMYNRNYETTSGGFCYAKALQGFNRSGYSILELDSDGQMLARKNADGTYSGFQTTFMYAPSPKMADLKTTPYMNRFMLSYTPTEIVNNGIIFTGAGSLLSMMGLVDSVISKGGEGSTTILPIKVNTECAGADLIAMFPQLAAVGNFIVTDKATGVVQTLTAAPIVAGVIDLTGTFTTGHTYHVVGAAPTVWSALTPTVEGYDGSSDGVDFLIP